jgi:hypothetical protein
MLVSTLCDRCPDPTPAIANWAYTMGGRYFSAGLCEACWRQMLSGLDRPPPSAEGNTDG